MLFSPKKVTVDTNRDKINELLTRGVDKVVGADELKKKLLSGKRLRVKLGIDPTSPHIHLGRATQLLKLKDFQDLGHTIVFIVGDATGVIGDTSDKDSERPMLTEGEVKENAKKYFDQAKSILDISRVEKHYNSKWLNKLTFSEIGKQANAFSVADFISRENIKKRLDSGKRVSLRETLYPLMQGYDSVVVNADVEIGGTDQWFNLLAGRTLQEVYEQEPQHTITNTLIRGLDGRKMSSSWGNTIILEGTPYDMYGKVMSLKDNLMEEYFVSCTRIPMSEVKEVLGGDPKSAKAKLAFEIVKMFHSEEDAKKAEFSFESTFIKGGIPDDTLNVSGRDKTLADILIEAKIVSSKNELRRLTEEGAITNMTSGKKISDINQTFEKSADIKIGKRRFVKINI